jgi:uncharacterized integral membrane protein (TIGR00697 family)
MNEKLLKEIINENQNLKYFFILSTFYLSSILMSITVSARLFPFHIPFTNHSILLTGGTWTIPLTFFVQDIATEVYGYSKSRQIIFLAIPIVILYIGYLKLTTFFPIPDVPNISSSYNEVLNALPRHLLAFLAAITAGNLINNILLSKLKKICKGKYLPLRFISSTAIGEAFLQIIGTTIAWFGSLHFTSEIIPFVIFSYFYKISFEIIATPINIYMCNWLKRIEGIDVYES